VTDDSAVAWLYRRTTGGIRWGLERTQALLAGVGDPHRRFRSLHIGGTNGKGSVAALCAAALQRTPAAGHVGLYTSPHLVGFRERIRVDGRPVAPDLLDEAVGSLRPAIERSEATFFEATTALAFRCFALAGVETAVVEVGLGGRLDATNVLQPLACAVTNIGLDHTEHLGPTLAEVAREKAGIFKAGVPAITAETDAEACAVLAACAERAGAPFARLDERAAVEILRLEPAATELRLNSAAWGSCTLRVGLAGAHQARNAALAAELLALLPAELRPSQAALSGGFSAARWPGRLQQVRAWGSNWLLDVAHNADGAVALAAAIDALALPRPCVLLAGILSDKDWHAMLPPLLQRVDAAVLSIAPTAPPDRRWDPAAAAAALADSPVSLRAIPDFEAALHRAATLAGHGTVIVTGSVHTVGDAMRLLQVPTI
jgi:dihydrofolate synthase / folylpolyglutamate synthase